MTEICVDLTPDEIVAAGVELGTIVHMKLTSGPWEYLRTLLEKVLLASEAAETSEGPAKPDG